jgi:translation initiation factor 4G
MTITRGPARGKSGGGGGGGGNNRGGNRNDGGGGGGGSDWGRGAAPPRQQAQNREGGGGGGGGGNRGGGGGNDWSRGQAPPKQQPQQQGQQQGKHGRGGRGQPPPLYDGPVAPLVKSENHWKPKKSKSAIDFAEKKVKSILNKMTKEKFDRLSTQMMEIPILSYEMLTIMIENVYDKAIDEPTFGDMYADLCVRLSQTVKGSAFVHILKSDEEAPTEGEASAQSIPNGGETSSYTVYRWSNDVCTTDSEIVGPFATADECVAVAVDMENEQAPTERGEMELELVSVSIQKGIFMKIMKKKEPEEDEKEIFYTIYFPVVEAEDCDQQLSDIFLSEMECRSDATKKNSFKSSLLNKCEVEFNKQDIYEDWKTEKREYEAKKSSMTAPERKEAESEFNFRRIKIKKQMLGNIKFIGQLFKKGLLKEKIMRFCIASLLKLEELKGVKTKNPEYKDSGDTDMDEEDHEAICSMFGTVGATLELPHAVDFMHVCFSKINALSNDTALPSRSRFMYKDLLDLRANRWVPRRKEEKAKTLEEIRKDVEIEERKQAQNSSRGGGGGGRGGDFRGDARGGRQQSFPSSNRPRQPKQATHTDADGFTVIGVKPAAPAPAPKSQTPKPAQSRTPLAVAKKSSSGGAAASKATNTPDPLSDEKLEKSIKSMRNDYVSDGGSMDELLLSMHEVSGTPGAGVKIVSLNVDRLMDCKDDERKAINSIIKILFEKKKITSDDVKNGFMDAIEFIDSFVMDSPRAYEYLGNLLGALLQIKAFDVEWLCEQLEKTKADPDTVAPVKLVRYTITSAGPSAKGSFSTAEKALVELLGADSWKAISQELLN